MKAAIVTAPGTSPVYGDFPEPAPRDGYTIVQVSASALSNLTKGRASGAHYSAENAFPAVPGTDGVGRNGRGERVYFAMPEPPFGAMAEQSLVENRLCVPVPDDLEDVTAAALANPGMSVFAALVSRARFEPGQSVLINGATGTAGRIAVQIARYLGAGRIVATGRNPAELAQLTALGADAVLPFALDADPPAGLRDYEQALIEEVRHGIDIVLDYLWGATARTIIAAIAKGQQDPVPVRFVQIGSAAGKDTIELPSAALRSSSIVLMGSGLKSVSMQDLLQAVVSTFAAARPAKLAIDTRAVPLSEVETAWNAPGKPRIVFTLP